MSCLIGSQRRHSAQVNYVGFKHYFNLSFFVIYFEEEVTEATHAIFLLGHELHTYMYIHSCCVCF